MSAPRDTVEIMTSDAAQQRVIEAPVPASGVVIGAPGTGKTATLIARMVALVERAGLEPAEVLALTPGRRAATRLRDEIGVRIAQATPGALARSLASFAFQVVRGAMVHAGQEPPALLTGADQDRILADLLAGDAADEADGRPSRWPAHLGPAVRATTTFRSELRAFLAECTELGLTPAHLRAKAQEAGGGGDVWVAVAGFLEEYRDVLGGMRAAHRDIPDLLIEAASIVRRAESAALGPLAALKVVLIDDAQELTRGGVALVRALHARGISVLAFGDPDISSGAFRGASPELFSELVGVLGSVHVLEVPHRQAPALTALTRTVTQSIGVAGRVEHRRAPGPVSPGEKGAVATFLAPSPAEEIDRIAGVLRDWHLNEGIAWDQMAVIAHDTRQILSLETELAAREVPTRAAGVQRPLGSEGAVRDLVRAVDLALTPAEARTAVELSEALCTPFGGMDAVGLRRLRARLRQIEFASGGSTPAGELLRQAMQHPAVLALIDAPEARAAERFATTLAETAAAAEAGETVHELLWRVWDRSRLHNQWLKASQEPGGAEISRALDSLVALFDAAKRFVERTPDERAAVFIRDILGSEIPEDSLSAGGRDQVVKLLTPATALGTEFEAVVIAGVQDGVWPNVRLRGGMLSLWRLTAGDVEALDRRRGALHDELRLFVRAISRARSGLVVTAVSDEDTSPSPLFGFLPEPTPASDHPSAEYPLTLRGLVMRHRRTLTTSGSVRAREEAAQQLAILAHEGVPGADPAQWYGVLEASTQAPVRDLTAQSARVSPSQMEKFEECGLDWAISGLGGDTVMAPSAGIGTIVHAAMEASPDGDLERMREILAERWSELDFDAEWIGVKERRRAEQYLERLHRYLIQAKQERVRVIANEAEFRFAVPVGDDDKDAPGAESVPVVVPLSGADPAPAGHAVIHGFVDRVEAYPVGTGEFAHARSGGWQEMASDALERVVVVDLKTGKSDPHSDTGVLDHAQLAAYQVAVKQGLVAGADPAALAGARLLLVAKTLSSSEFRIAHQHRLDDDDLAKFLRRTGRAARGMAASRFVAQVEAHCTATRPWRSVCLLHTIPPVSA